ncbi:hypothetical protein BSL78_01921 [Apostichopus japonicus]|uniref:EF-hand domain-containing protein n=1 Tax=Stichopus japonicus TaxID=307972 RepID=A0A2G8LLG0_STIJA|nr:hypothetical protein BSL78_01921 [Apostichopus japonicus]
MAKLTKILMLFVLVLAISITVNARRRRKGRLDCKKGSAKFNANCIRNQITRRRKGRSVGGDVDTSKLNRIFTKLDENNDGLIDGREWLAASCNKGIRQFTELLDEFDINGDERISLNELEKDDNKMERFETDDQNTRNTAAGLKQSTE